MNKMTVPDQMTESTEYAKESVQVATLNPKLPPETENTENFARKPIEKSTLSLTGDQWQSALHGAELKDVKQRIWLRPFFAGTVFLLLGAQNLGVWFIVVWAIQRSELSQLQLVFSTLVAGTLTQSYLILKFITNRVFSDIDYHNGSEKR